jgi:hypothetical protein
MLPAWDSRKFKGWNHCALMPWRVELVLLGLPQRFGTNCPVLDYFCKQKVGVGIGYGIDIPKLVKYISGINHLILEIS